ncbi:Ribosomal-protein-alanine acetyltransferase [Mycena kentingensis (nom. inval.)]|nr:Ribosomal-protein-alanine acetyltransferase [Mycena kentingensis (nom. inval.)]
MNSTPSEGAAAAQKAKLEAAFLLLGDVRITNYIAAAVASLTLYACDYISTLEKEIELVWKRRPSMSDLIYIWVKKQLAVFLELFESVLKDSILHIRYPCVSSIRRAVSDEKFIATPRVNVIFNLSTARSNEGQVTTSAIIVGCADLILATRVWILYRRARLLLWILLPLVLLEIASMMVDGFVAILPLKEFLHLGPQLGGCYPAEPVRLLTYFTVGPLIVQFIMFTLTAYKCTKTMAVMGPGRTPLITMFLRDGVFWFMTALAICVVDFVIWSSARPTLAQVAVV